MLKSVLFSPARKNMYVQLLVILAMVLVTQHVVSRDMQHEKNGMWNIGKKS